MEEQLTGKARYGGLQIVVCPEGRPLRTTRPLRHVLSAGGDVRRVFHGARHGSCTRRQDAPGPRCLGEPPPTAKNCTANGLPWFECYGDDPGAIEDAAKLKSITDLAKLAKLKDNGSLDVTRVIGSGKKPRRQVREPRAGEAWA